MIEQKINLFRIPGRWISLLLIMSFSAPSESLGTAHFLQTNNIQFVEEVVYSEPDDVMFGKITAGSADHSGRVFMGDNDQKMVHVFNADGHYLSSFGSQGNGPGEFQMISKIAIDKVHIHVFDMIQGRINIFSVQDFEFIRTITLSSNGGMQRRTSENTGPGRPFDFHLLSDGNYLVSYRTMVNPDQRGTAIVSPKGEILASDTFKFVTGSDGIVDNSSGSMVRIINLPFSRKIGLAVSGSGLIFSNWSEHLEFNVHDESGKSIRTFSQTHQNAELDRAELYKMVENFQGQGTVMGAGGQRGTGGGSGPPGMQQMLQNMKLPDAWPAVHSMYADQHNRLWVSTYTEKAHELKWFLFDESGRLTGTFTWPASSSVVHADGRSVYVLDRPGDDFDKVIRYRF